MRAADAAKNTSDLIEGAVKKVKEGSGLVSRTNEAFVKVSEGSLKVGELVGEIAAASGEQAQGITRVNQAAAEMDRVIRQNAASAEESASASEEMNGQGERMMDMVGTVERFSPPVQNAPLQFFLFPPLHALFFSYFNEKS